MSDQLTDAISCDSEDFAGLSCSILGKGLSLRFKAFGSSMRPFVKHGDIVVVEPADGKECRVGDIIFFQDVFGRMRLHRIIRRKCGKDKIHFVIKGDSLAGTDGEINNGQVLGKMISIERGKRTIYCNRLTAKIKNHFIALLSPISFIIYPAVSIVKKIFRQIKELGL